MGKFIDLTGMTFGRWKVIERAPNKNKRTMWLCECSCKKHTRKIIDGNSLKSKVSQSCGCLVSELIIKRNKEFHKINTYNMEEEYGIGYTSNTNEPFYFDREDYDLIKNYCWLSRHDNREGRDDSYYIESAYKTVDGKRKRIHLHHLVLGFNNKVDTNIPIIDHINRIKFDCRKQNLRQSNTRKNNINRDLQKSNTSGVIGVNYNVANNVWVARICDELNHRIVLCQVRDKEKAIKARLEAEKEYYGDLAPQRHLFKEYGINDI